MFHVASQVDEREKAGFPLSLMDTEPGNIIDGTNCKSSVVRKQRS